MAPDEIEDILSKPTCSVDQVGRIYGLSRNKAYKAVEEGEIESIRFGRLIRVPTASVRRRLGLSADAQRHPESADL